MASQEGTDVNVRGVAVFAIGLIVTAALIHAVVGLLFMYFNSREGTTAARQYPLAVTEENRRPPEPRLQTNPREDLQEMRAEENAVLNGYGWVDRSAGVVRIPIDRAIQLTLERGLPARAEEAK